MERYPNFEEYLVPIGLPAKFFSDPEIKTRIALRDSSFTPEFDQGNFAITFRFVRTDQTGKIAVRCFKTEITGVLDRYRAIQNFLKNLKSKFFVDFAVSGPAPGQSGKMDGVLVGGRWLPVMRMEWIDGVDFTTAIKARLDSPAKLGLLRAQLLLYSDETERHCYAHGDIHPDNILVMPSGEMKLVDYDGIFVPALSNLDSPIAGQPDFQSPARLKNPTFFGPSIDRFPLLVLDLTLAALQRAPGLLPPVPPGEGILLCHADFLDPEHSPTLAILEKLPGLAGMVRVFRQACACPLDQVPTLAILRRAETRQVGFLALLRRAGGRLAKWRQLARAVRPLPRRAGNFSARYAVGSLAVIVLIYAIGAEYFPKMESVAVVGELPRKPRAPAPPSGARSLTPSISRGLATFLAAAEGRLLPAPARAKTPAEKCADPWQWQDARRIGYAALKEFYAACPTPTAAIGTFAGDAFGIFATNFANAYDDARSLEAAQLSVQLTGNNAVAHLNLGTSLNAVGNGSAAIVEFRKSIELDPKIALAHYNLGSALANQQEFAEAIAELTRAVQINHNFPNAWNNLGLAWAQTKNYAKAITAFKTAVELRPGFAEALAGLSDSYTDTGNYAAAIATSAELIRRDPLYPAAYNSLGRIYLKMREYSLAADQFRKAADLAPEERIFRSNLALAQAALRGGRSSR